MKKCLPCEIKRAKLYCAFANISLTTTEAKVAKLNSKHGDPLNKEPYYKLGLTAIYRTNPVPPHQPYLIQE